VNVSVSARVRRAFYISMWCLLRLPPGNCKVVALGQDFLRAILAITPPVLNAHLHVSYSRISVLCTTWFNL